MGLSSRRKWLKDKERKKWLDSLKPGDKVKYHYSDDTLPSFEVKVDKRMGNVIEVVSEQQNYFLLSSETGAAEPVDKHTYMYILPLEVAEV